MSKKNILLILLCLTICPIMAGAQSSPVLSIETNRFKLNGKPFDYTGLSFFNALYNPAFNKDDEARNYWLKKFNGYGITAIRIWAEWNSDRGFVDTDDSCILYNRDGSIKPIYLNRLKHLIESAGALHMVVELVLFSNESLEKKLSDEASDKAVKGLTLALKSYRNVIFQIWNEHDHRVSTYFHLIKKYDPTRITTNSPGGGGHLGNDAENRMLDYLSPHTTRPGEHWEKAAKEIRMLLQKFHKPVVDDEPARTGTRKYGGPEGKSFPYDQILHMYNVWQAGGYVTYHHDMFQTGYGSKAVPPNGIPDPDFSLYHHTVFEFLQQKERYEK